MAGPFYVDSGATFTDGESWSGAYTSLKTCLDAAAVVAGSVVYVDSTYNDVLSAATTLDSLGTDVAPIIIMSVLNEGATDGSGGTYTPGAKFKTTGGVYTFDFASTSHVISYGVDYVSGDDLHFNSDSSWEFFDCIIGMAGTDGADQIEFNGGNDSAFTFNNVLFTFGSTAQGIDIAGGATITMRGCGVDSAGSAVVELIEAGAGTKGFFLNILDCDFSDMGSTGTVIGYVPTVGVRNQASTILLSNVILPPSGTITSETVGTGATVFEAYNISTTTEDNPNSYYVHTVYGIAQDDQDVWLDSTNEWSIKATTYTAAGVEHRPLRFLLGELWTDGIQIVGVRGIIDGTIPNDDEFWLEIVCPPSTELAYESARFTSTSLHAFNNVPGEVTGNTYPARATSGSALTVDTANDGAWTETTITTEAEFLCEIDLDGVYGGHDAGVVQVWVNWARSNATCYVDSKVVIENAV